MDLVICVARQLVRNKEEELKTFWKSSGISYGGLHEVVARHYLITLTDRCSFLLCFWSTRDHS